VRAATPSQKAPSSPLSYQQAWEALHNTYTTVGLDKGIGSHAMRKTFAKRIYAGSGRNLLKTQVALGHKNINSTVADLGVDQEEVDALILAYTHGEGDGHERPEGRLARWPGPSGLK
jgi:site-specific recombinase XerD